ncbi:hypothetical protein CGL51_09365 [Pyrobaculum aerophilum]|uniref:Endonuclease GajA/Old nuclease/RecF-like AAA domain-containing protein n=1 Tax=Pyrobaculum aerophilum TaxID=13773 RepID=A0A371QWL7_9CREN|nr:hypothetical protein CGL51_09365 [Pyrobaculum aerophilum]RFA95874.1 hypothetical protein CGL52_12080 [Pyrobaculum aerophilum]
MYFYPETLLIENFKSIRRLELKLRPGVNLLVGPNASGKTNILEAIYSFHKALFPRELLKIPYSPHLPMYWRASDLFYMGDTSKHLGFGLSLRRQRICRGKLYTGRVNLYAKFLHKGDSVEPRYVEITANAIGSWSGR